MFELLSVQDVKKQYNHTTALNGVSLDIPSSICFGLVGPNGAGKSTLIKILASVIQDYEGTVRYERMETGQMKNEVGYVPQEICLEPTLSALDNLYFFGRLYGLRGKKLKSRAQIVLQDIGLEEHGKDKVLTFSGGMKRRLNIGCALMHNPNIIIMDEPTVGIDPQSRKYIFQMIEDLKRRACTIVYASHYMEEVEQLCDEIAMMDNGYIVEQGNIKDILRKYTYPSVFVRGVDCLPKDIEQYCRVETRNGGYLVRAVNPLEVMAKILNYSKENQGQINQLELVQPRLEDVFFTLTGSQLRD
ncbi:ABC transporter ATP-binding protein [Ornithinibacillus scapharcae]|uniref:ABC transporter ATP-binding protein n=1 Tax=Ornithinibacillus scapharcae TaxID=1147159 RepID=UPI001ED8D700|nr:ABC transporter ATP-binding protein [Ornithinibacillus scapharcae]